MEGVEHCTWLENLDVSDVPNYSVGIGAKEGALKGGDEEQER